MNSDWDFEHKVAKVAKSGFRSPNFLTAKYAEYAKEIGCGFLIADGTPSLGSYGGQAGRRGLLCGLEFERDVLGVHEVVDFGRVGNG
jgi:hypothetical protein